MAERPKLRPEVTKPEGPDTKYDWECPGCGMARHGRKNVICGNPACPLHDISMVQQWLTDGIIYLSLPKPIQKSVKQPEPVSNDVEVGWFEQQLTINKTELDTAISQQPSLFHQVSDRYASAISRRDMAKDKLKRQEAYLYLTIKQEYMDKSEKVTEAFLDASVLTHPDRRKYQKDLIAAEEEVNRWDGLKESFRQRSFMLRDLVSLEVGSFFQEPSVKGSDRLQQDHLAAQGRSAMQVKREQYQRRS